MKILFVGASGYGNIGDDTYPLVFAEHLQGHDLVFHNSDLPDDLPGDADLLVMGGGGILHNVRADPEHDESPHFRCMRHYMDWAIARGIPWGFLSCGFQFDIGVDSSRLDSLRPWIPYLKQAHFVTVRSPVCARIVGELSGRSDGRFFPDAAYLYRPTTDPPPADEPKTVMVVPAGRVHAENRLVRHFIRLLESVHHHIVWLGMGAPSDDQPHLDAATRWQPGALTVQCRNPLEAYGHIARSRFVITGRYHGMVFARSREIPFFVPEHTQHKIRCEDLTIDPAAAIGHIETLHAMLAS